MLFPTVEYALFFLAAFAGAWSLAPWPRAHKTFLLFASWAFYAYGDWRFLPVLLGLSIEAGLVAQALALPLSERTRQWVLAAGITAALGTLALFKYLGFFASIVVTVTHSLGVTAWKPHLPELALPFGVSFFTFHAISLMVDAWRRRIVVEVKLLDALLYVAFFPQLVAGPILRASSFLPTLATPRSPGDLDTARALQRIVLGLFKKVIVAQVLASELVDPVFDDPQAHDSLTVLLGVYAYAAQIYCDFSGYTDLAIGSALLLGYPMPENFDAPYRADSPRDFWRRWHLSLSTWLRDYLFIPLGGSRGNASRTAAALAMTMVLGGLWHGAAWTFVAWGAFHGAWLVLHRAWSSAKGTSSFRALLGWKVLAPVLTFHFVCIGWVLFRSTSFAGALEVFSAIAQVPTSMPSLALTALVALGVALAAMPKEAMDRVHLQVARWPAVAQGVAFGLILVALDALGPRGISPFIYFQF